MWAPLATVAAEEGPEETKPLEVRNLWRIEWANDAVVSSDNAFTNGFSVQRHSHQHDLWEDMGPSKFSRWISRTVPGLGDAGGRIVKRGSGVTQVMMTPEDISNPEPQLDDVPWAGALGWSDSWYAYDNKRLNAFQVYVGILGPASLAEQTQILVHSLIGADEPNGWDNQLKTEPLLNINYAYKYKLVSSKKYMKGFGGDLAVGAHAGLGNFWTFAEATLEARFGWRLPRGFVNTPKPPARGIMLDPTEGVPGEFHLYFSIAARVSATGYTVFYDGNTFTESPHPGLEYDPVVRGAVFGIHMASKRFSAHLNLNVYNELPFESENPVTDMTWGILTLEYRF